MGTGGGLRTWAGPSHGTVIGSQPNVANEGGGVLQIGCGIRSGVGDSGSTARGEDRQESDGEEDRPGEVPAARTREGDDALDEKGDAHGQAERAR